MLRPAYGERRGGKLRGCRAVGLLLAVGGLVVGRLLVSRLLVGGLLVARMGLRLAIVIGLGRVVGVVAAVLGVLMGWGGEVVSA